MANMGLRKTPLLTHNAAANRLRRTDGQTDRQMAVGCYSLYRQLYVSVALRCLNNPENAMQA